MVAYLPASTIVAAERGADLPNPYVTGYGQRIPTSHMVTLDDGRKRRVYVMCYGNSGSAYVRAGTRTLFIGPEAEERIEALLKAPPREVLPVIFRKERGKGGDVTAVFPTLPADNDGYLFTVYAHIGQHSGGSLGWYHGTKAAKPADYADLLAELRGIYGDVTLQVYQRMTASHRAEFRKALQS